MPHILKRLGERSYQSSAGAWTRSWPCNFENASHAHGIWPSASTLSWWEIKEIENEVQKNSTSTKKLLKTFFSIPELKLQAEVLSIFWSGLDTWMVSDRRQPHIPSGLKCEQNEQCCQECNHVAHIQIGTRALKSDAMKKKLLAELESEDYRCFLTNEFQRCIICFSSLVTSTKSSSICNISACNNINNKAPHNRVTTYHNWCLIGPFPMLYLGATTMMLFKPFSKWNCLGMFQSKGQGETFASTKSNAQIFFIKMSNMLSILASVQMGKNGSEDSSCFRDSSETSI